jgi:hypothetical protein
MSATTRRVLARPLAPPHPEFKNFLATAFRALAAHDVIVGAYLGTLAVAAITADPQPVRSTCVHQTGALFGGTLAIVTAVRGGLLGRNAAASLLYRSTLVAAIVGSYLILRHLLPLVSPGTLDRELYALDVALFGGEPALWMQRWATALATQWFAFWYFAYFFVLAAYALPLLLGDAPPRLASELCLVIALTFCTSHLCYFVVPGWGPHRFLADRFAAPLPAGRWTAAVGATVSAGGALKDIFPSLHVAAPTVLALFAFRHRRRSSIFRLAWPATAFAALNGTVATMFLRWHYVIDVVAGLALAVAVAPVSARLAAWECARRARAGLEPAWPPLRRATKHPPSAALRSAS